MIYRLTNQLGDEVLATDKEIREHALIPVHHKRTILSLATEAEAELSDDRELITARRIA